MLRARDPGLRPLPDALPPTVPPRRRLSRRIRLLLAGVAALVLLVAATVTGVVLRSDRVSAPPPPRPMAALVPRTGILLGAYVDLNGTWHGSGAALYGIEQREKQLGRTFAIDHHFYGWSERFPTELERADLSAGRIPLISWQGIKLDRILDGSQDRWIVSRAHALAGLRKPVFLRWAWEMNGDWSPADGPRNNSPGRHDGPDKYVAAWRHIHDLFAKAHATNVVWVWCPNVESSPRSSWNHADRYYPGDAYVDWVGVDAYNWGHLRPWSTWQSLVSMVRPFQKTYGYRKPIMIAETSSAQAAGGKADWISGLRTHLPQLPAVAAIVWFDVNKEEDWRIDSSPSVLAAMRQLANDPTFMARVRP